MQVTDLQQETARYNSHLGPHNRWHLCSHCCAFFHLPVFELISGVQPSLLSLLFQVTSQCPLYPDHVSDTSENALHFSSSFLPVLFCGYMRKIVSPITDTSQSWRVWVCGIHWAVYCPVQLSLQEQTQAPILFPLKKLYDESIPEWPPVQNKR